MKCVRIHRFGGPETLQLDELTLLMPGAGEIVVRVAAASVNPVDYKIRTGTTPYVAQKDLPFVMGQDGAGVVARLGQGVEGLEIGEAVLLFVGWDRGTYAQEVVVRQGEWTRVPDGLDMDAAAALPLAGVTAWQGLFDHGALEAGQHVLVHGGSGGVGHLAVQLAKQKGARVTATCGTDAVEFVRSLGADEVVDYKKHKFEHHGRDVDLVYDLIGGDTRQRSWAVLKPGGRLVSAVRGGDAPAEAEAAGSGRTGLQYAAHPDAEQLAELAGLAASGKLRVHIDKSFPLDKAADAQSHVETGHPKGKVILKPEA